MLPYLNLHLCRIFYVVLLLGHNFREFTALPLVPEAPLSSLGSPPGVGSRQGETTTYSPGKQPHTQLTASTLRSTEQILPVPSCSFHSNPLWYLPCQAVLCSETSSVVTPRLHFRSICKKKPKPAPPAAPVLFQGQYFAAALFWWEVQAQPWEANRHLNTCNGHGQ